VNEHFIHTRKRKEEVLTFSPLVCQTRRKVQKKKKKRIIEQTKVRGTAILRGWNTEFKQEHGSQ